MQDMGDVRVFEAVDVHGVDKVITHLWNTCKPQEPCCLCLANSSLMKEAWHRSHPHLVCNNRIATQISPMCANGTTIGMCVSHVDLMLRMATRPPQAHSTR
jgi:hypothetical protein